MHKPLGKFWPALLIPVSLLLNSCSTGPILKQWHTERLSEEFTLDKLESEVGSFPDYLKLEERLFNELQDKVYAETSAGPEESLNRYSSGSSADPNVRSRNWNRSFELSVGKPSGGVLLLHGMSDSPYSLRALGQRLHRNGYHVIGLRLPGHGTAPSGLRYMTWQDMAAAADLAIEQLTQSVGDRPIHIVGYSTGAALALNAALDAIEQGEGRLPDSLILISPAIRVHSAAAFASFKNSLSGLPGLDGLAYLTVMDEFDPFKYNSFATNAGAQVHLVTRHVDQRIRALIGQDTLNNLPPILVFKSAVDATVTTEAVVDHLLKHLPEDRNELVLFDINRQAAVKSTLLIDDPGPFTQRLMNEPDLPFAITFISNASADSMDVVAQRKPPNSSTMDEPETLDHVWPRGVVSLSHVALPIPADDPLYGIEPPADRRLVYLGNLAIKGERGLLKISESWLLRLRFNPFYEFLEDRAVKWIKAFEQDKLVEH